MAEDVDYSNLPARKRKLELMKAYEKMFGKDVWQKGLTKDQQQQLNFINDPEFAGRIAGELSKKKEQMEMAHKGAYIKAKYGPGSSQYGNFLAMQRAMYDPRREY